jgi:glycosyltransferase involved in cell wall biosynthesis
VTSHLLDIPRGVSCYADHLLHDYPLKIVPVHLRTCDVVVATSRRIQTELETINGAPLPSVVVKPNAIDPSRFTSGARRPHQPEEPLRVVCVSRLDPKKGLEFVLDAVRILVERGTKVDLQILGAADAASAEGQEYEAALRARVATLNLTGAVTFAGRQDGNQVRAALETCDVFVAASVELPSGDKDGIPTSLLEAMAAGCAIVATDAGSILEAITHDREGLVVPQRDGAALAAAIARISTDESLATRLRAGASARALREFDVALTEGAFHERVREVIGRRRTAWRRARGQA